MEPSTTNPFLNIKVMIILLTLLIASSVISVFLSRHFDVRESVVLGSNPLPRATSQEISGSVVVGTAPEVRMIFGVVKSLSLDGFVVTMQGVVTANNPLSERIVKVTNETKITTFIKKDSKIFADEMAQYEKRVKDAVTHPQIALSPDPVIKKEVPASEIHVGDTVRVISGSDVSAKKEFIAEEVQFYPTEVAQVKK